MQRGEYKPGARADPVRLTSADLRWLTGLIKDGDVHPFYVWKKWLAERAFVLECDNNECQRHRERGRFCPAVVVHHRLHLRAAPQFALSMWRQDGGVWVRQLESLCKECHDEEHPERLIKKIRPALTPERWD